MKSWILWLIIGLISLAGGLAALFNPFAATITAELMIGWLFVAIGALTVLSAFQDRGMGARIAALALGALMLALGISLVSDPLGGIVALTIVAAVLLFTGGIFRIVLGFSAMMKPLRWAMVASGALSILFSLLIMSNFPQSAAVLLGLYLAVDLISNGIAMIVLALARKSDPATSDKAA